MSAELPDCLAKVNADLLLYDSCSAALGAVPGRGGGEPVPHAGEALLVIDDARSEGLFRLLFGAAQEPTWQHTRLSHSGTHWLTSSDVLVRTRPLGLPVKPIMFMRLLAAAEPPPYILAVLH